MVGLAPANLAMRARSTSSKMCWATLALSIVVSNEPILKREFGVEGSALVFPENPDGHRATGSPL